MTPSTPAPKCKADFYALWCDNCNLHPVNCPLRSTPAPTDAGALEAARQTAADAIRTFCRSLGSASVQISSDGVERIYYSGIPLDALSVAVAMALRNSAPQETRGDEPLYRRVITKDRIWYEPAAPQQSPRLEREGIKAALAAKKHQKNFPAYGDHKGDWVHLNEDEIADAILALLSPDSTVVSSTDPRAPYDVRFHENQIDQYETPVTSKNRGAE